MYHFNLCCDYNPYVEISESIDMENITKGRLGNIIVDISDDKKIPIVRTTTKYNSPVKKFRQCYIKIIENINNAWKIIENTQNDLKFNNAMIELYTPQYKISLRSSIRFIARIIHCNLFML